jgi:hypothetical protein
MTDGDQFNKFKIDDRVRRQGGAKGCNGSVKHVGTDVTSTTAEAKEKGVLVKVLWDNGTASVMSPDALENAQS